MKTLVTGSVGFVDFHLSLNLLKRDYSLVSIDSLNEYYDIGLKKNSIIFDVKSVLNKDANIDETL